MTTHRDTDADAVRQQWDAEADAVRRRLKQADTNSLGTIAQYSGLEFLQAVFSG